MAALSLLRTELKQRTNNQTSLSNSILNRFINNALEDWANTVEPLWRQYSWYITAKQFRYDLPTDWLKPKQLHWYQNGEKEIEFLSPKEFQRWGFLDWDRTVSSPQVYTIIDNDIYLAPAPSTSGNTDILTGSLTSSATSTAVVDGTNFHTHGGFVLVGTEQMVHQGISTNTLTLLLRGQGGTTAAAHNACDTIYRNDLVATYFYVPAALSADADVPAIDLRHHRTILHHAIASILRATGREEEAALEMQMYEGKKGEAKRDARSYHRDTYRGIVTPYE